MLSIAISCKRELKTLYIFIYCCLRHLYSRQSFPKKVRHAYSQQVLSKLLSNSRYPVLFISMQDNFNNDNSKQRFLQLHSIRDNLHIQVPKPEIFYLQLVWNNLIQKFLSQTFLFRTVQFTTIFIHEWLNQNPYLLFKTFSILRSLLTTILFATFPTLNCYKFTFCPESSKPVISSFSSLFDHWNLKRILRNYSVNVCECRLIDLTEKTLFTATIIFSLLSIWHLLQRVRGCQRPIPPMAPMGQNSVSLPTTYLYVNLCT